MNNYNLVTKSIIKELSLIVGKKNIYIDKKNLKSYGHDETENLNFPPEVLLKPLNTKEVAEVMNLAFLNNIPVTPIGARTGLSGGSLCVHGGIGLSMERFNKILKIDLDNLQIKVQPGVITQTLQEDYLSLFSIFY